MLRRPERALPIHIVARAFLSFAGPLFRVSWSGVSVPAENERHPEVRHRVCWYARRTTTCAPELGFHTIEDGQLLYCAHPMMFPIVGYEFDVRNCGYCESFRPTRVARGS
jgi:hypothetical protein